MMNIDPETLMLQKGAHKSPEDGFCVMELTAYLAREPHSDHPACTSQVIAAFLRTWNDMLDDETRQLLRPYARRVIGTRASRAIEKRRAWMAADWLVRVNAPAWLDLAKLNTHAATLRALPEMTPQTAAGIRPTLKAAAEASAAAKNAAEWDAAAAKRNAWGVEWDRALEATRDAASDAAADTYAAYVAHAAARVATSNAARVAAWDTETANETLAPVVERLQCEAFVLLDRMIACR